MARSGDELRFCVSRDEQFLLAQWAREFRLPLIKFFQKRAPGNTEPEDLAQEVFVRLARRSNLASVERIEGYLFQTAASVLADRFRRNGRSLDVAESYDEASHGEETLTPERLLMGEQALVVLVEALHALPVRTRDIFVLYHLENVRQKEIAKRFDMPISTVEKHMARANRHLLRRMREDK